MAERQKPKKKENKKLTGAIIGCPVNPKEIEFINKPTKKK